MLKENFDIEIEMTGDGLKALELFTEGFNKPCKCPNRAYKLIFMDLQMPVMDG